MKTLPIVAVIVDINKLVLYFNDGSTMDIPQGDPRVRVITEKVLPVVEAGGSISVDLGAQLEEANNYKEFEQKSNGLVRFFRAAKETLANIFQSEEALKEASPAPTAPTGVHGKVPPTPVEQIMANAKPVTANDYDHRPLADDETMVAVVDGQIIENTEALSQQIKHSVELGSTKGMENFFKRVAKVIDKRRHSVEDLLKFLEKADLPIADDGSFIAYKALKRSSDGNYRDIHSGNVPQKVGSYVHMDENMVDPSRHHDCSNGLHIARRDYLGGFRGDVCVIAKIAPEDVIAVPQYSPSKIRVCGYHILFELPRDAYHQLLRDKSMTGYPQAQKMLGAAISGAHTPVVERVKIGGQRGTNITITPVTGGKKVSVPSIINQAPAARSMDDDIKNRADPKQLSEQISKKVEAGSRQQKAQAFVTVLRDSKDPKHQFKAADELLAFKKKAKVSWDVLGVPAEIVTLAQDLVAKGEPKEAPKPVKPAKVVKPAKPKAAKPAAQTETREQRINRLVTKFYNGTTEEAVEAARELIDIQKTARKSWASMGQSGLSNGELEAFIKVNGNKKPEPKAMPAKEAVTMVTGAETRQQKARRLFKAKDWTGLWAHKKTVKVGWERLGFTPEEIKEISSHV